MSEIKTGRLGLHGAEHLKCDRMMALGFKGLRQRRDVYWSQDVVMIAVVKSFLS